MNARENPEIHLFPGVFADIKRACEKDMVHLFSQYIYITLRLAETPVTQ